MFDKLSKIYNLVGAEAVLTQAEDLRKYLTGFSSTFGYVLTDKDGSTFYTDLRYLEAAESALKDSGIEVKKFTKLDDILKTYRQVGVPFDKITYSDYLALQQLNVSAVDSSAAFTRAMSIKERYEIENIEKACEIADWSFTGLLSHVKEGITENELGAILEFLMRKRGAAGTSFDTIVAFGENSSVPHHETSDRKLRFGDVILIDFGCKYDGYCSDCTRTMLFGDDGKHEEFKLNYQRVLMAHKLVKRDTYSGMKGKDADAIARDYLKSCGLDQLFTHSLGHGIGINIHEFPRLSPKSEDELVNGMVFSDEPGIYIAGKYGIRIEDTVMLKNGGVESLTDSDKGLIIL